MSQFPGASELVQYGLDSPFQRRDLQLVSAVSRPIVRETEKPVGGYAERNTYMVYRLSTWQNLAAFVSGPILLLAAYLVGSLLLREIPTHFSKASGKIFHGTQKNC